jgi:DNA-binding transcriptional regulator YiaG
MLIKASKICSESQASARHKCRNFLLNKKVYDNIKFEGARQLMTGAIARRLESLRSKVAIKDFEVANLLGTRPETVSRWNHGRAYPRVKTEKMLRDLEYIIDRLADFYEPNEARQWIFAPQKRLGGISPAELIRSGRIDDVMRLVGQLRDAVHL